MDSSGERRCNWDALEERAVRALVAAVESGDASPWRLFSERIAPVQRIQFGLFATSFWARPEVAAAGEPWWTTLLAGGWAHDGTSAGVHRWAAAMLRNPHPNVVTLLEWGRRSGLDPRTVHPDTEETLWHAWARTLGGETSAEQSAAVARWLRGVGVDPGREARNGSSPLGAVFLQSLKLGAVPMHPENPLLSVLTEGRPELWHHVDSRGPLWVDLIRQTFPGTLFTNELEKHCGAWANYAAHHPDVFPKDAWQKRWKHSNGLITTAFHRLMGVELTKLQVSGSPGNLAVFDHWCTWVERALREGADVGATDGWGDTPMGTLLRERAFGEETVRRLEVLRRAGARPEQAFGGVHAVFSVLHRQESWSDFVPVAESILREDTGGLEEAWDEHGRGVLQVLLPLCIRDDPGHAAASEGQHRIWRVECLDRWTEMGLDWERPDGTGQTASDVYEKLRPGLARSSPCVALQIDRIRSRAHEAALNRVLTGPNKGCRRPRV